MFIYTFGDMTQITLYFLACCLISSIAVVVNWFSYKMLMAEAIFSTLLGSLGIKKKLHAASFFVTLLIPFVIFPVAAYFLSPKIYSLPYSDTTRSLIYISFSIFPFLCLMLIFGWLLVKKIRHQRFQLRLAQMIAADPSVELLSHKFNSLSPGRGILELKVRIDNLIPVIPKISFETRLLEDIYFYKLYDDTGDSGWLEASFEDGRWIFSNSTTKKKISDDETGIPYQVRFSRSYDQQPYGLPRSIRLILGARNPVSGNTEYFYYRDLVLDSL